MDLQFLCRVPRIIILNNPLHESNVSKDIPHSLSQFMPARILRGRHCQDSGGSGSQLLLHVARTRDVTSGLLSPKVPGPPSTNLILPMMSTPSTCERPRERHELASLPTLQPHFLSLPRSPIWGQVRCACCCLDTHSFRAWHELAPLPGIPPPPHSPSPWLCHSLPSSLGAKSPLIWGLLWNEFLYLVPTPRGGLVLEGPEAGPVPLQQSQVTGSRNKGHLSAGLGALWADSGLLLLGGPLCQSRGLAGLSHGVLHLLWFCLFVQAGRHLEIL